MRLCPDIDSRCTMIVSLYPALWDKRHLVDVIRDLDHVFPVPDPAAPPPAEGNALLAGLLAHGAAAAKGGGSGEGGQGEQVPSTPTKPLTAVGAIRMEAVADAPPPDGPTSAPRGFTPGELGTAMF